MQVARLGDLAPTAALLAVVKANGYGHGMAECARAAREADAAWLGVATVDEALELRSHGDTGPVLCWLNAPGADYAAAIEENIEVTASSADQLREIASAAGDQPARVQLKVDTGLSRNGARGLSRDDRRVLHLVYRPLGHELYQEPHVRQGNRPR